MSTAPSHADAAAAQRTARLRTAGVPEAVATELAAYVAHPYAAVDGGPALPLADEPHIDAWLDYAAEAERDGAAPVLRRRLAQLRFPIAAGMGSDAAYRAAVLRGASTPGRDEGGVEFVDPAGLAISVQPTAAGRVPIVVARERADFVTLVQALTARNEPIGVPEAMGACLVKGLVNQDRVARHRARWAAARDGDDDGAAWTREFTAFAATPANYQDRLIVLSSGPYSAVPAAETDRDAATWLGESLAIRREHELFHYLTLRRFGVVRSNLLDEILADFAGLVAGRGAYEPDLALRCLGIERRGDGAIVRDGARLLVYRGNLGDEAVAALAALAVRAVDALGAVFATAPPSADPEVRGALLLALAACGLDGLAAGEAAGAAAALSAAPAAPQSGG